MSPNGAIASQQVEDQQRITALDQFKNAIQDCKLPDTSDDYLMTWLKAKDYNVEAAETMLRESLEWRRVNNVDTILETYKPPPILLKYYSFGGFGYDKFGSQVCCTAQGLMDLKGILQSITRKDFIRAVIWFCENGRKKWRDECEKSGRKGLYRTTVIADTEHLTLGQFTNKLVFETMIEQIQIYQKNYPLTMRRVFVINASKVSMIIHKLMTPFLDKNLVEQLRIFGTNKEEWKAALLSEIDADQIPAYFGGTMVGPDGDPTCPHRWNMGGKVPRSCYLVNNLPAPKENMQTLSVRASSGGQKKMKLNVQVANSTIRFEFMTEGGDIAYRIYRKCPLEEGVTELVPMHRVDSHLIMEQGEIACDSIGMYVIQFDNSYSYFHTKKVHYSVDIVDPAMKQQNYF